MEVITGINSMKIVHARNVNEAYTIGMRMLHEDHDLQDSRVGEVMVHPSPVTTVYTHPYERVLFNKDRDANPFFHLMEGLWMLSGRNDVGWISQYNSGFKKFSDNGRTFHGAYGHRWRVWFNCDQLDMVATELKDNPDSRRCYVEMWDATADLCKEGVDFPCNVGIAFRVREAWLDMTVFNRSNDIIWGAYGANAVHMSMLQEYMAAKIDKGVGTYYQVSNNYHAYVEVWDKVKGSDIQPHPMDPYKMGEVLHYPMIQNIDKWDELLPIFMAEVHLFHHLGNEVDYKFDVKQLALEPFFDEVAIPMVRAWGFYKRKDAKAALKTIHDIKATDWRKACIQWLVRRMERNATSNAEKRRFRKAVAHDN